MTIPVAMANGHAHSVNGASTPTAMATTRCRPIWNGVVSIGRLGRTRPPNGGRHCHDDAAGARPLLAWLDGVCSAVEVRDIPMKRTNASVRGAPDTCWTRDFNLHHPDRGARRVAGRC